MCYLLFLYFSVQMLYLSLSQPLSLCVFGEGGQLYITAVQTVEGD